MSLGGALYRVAMDGLVKAGQELLAGNIAGAVPTLTSRDIAHLLPPGRP